MELLIQQHPKHVCLRYSQGQFRKRFILVFFQDDGGANEDRPHMEEQYVLISSLSNLTLRLLRVLTFAIMGNHRFNSKTPAYPDDRPGQTT